MNHYFTQPSPQRPAQDILLDHLMPRTTKPAGRFGKAGTPEEVAAIIVQDMLETIKSAFNVPPLNLPA